MKDIELIKTKKHYEILDGLRGVAAISVVIYHFLEMVFTDTNYTKSPFVHSFLAVDFFFCLSGFVIAYAYDSRIEKMGVIEFFKSRLIRLHPLVIIGSVLGLIGYYLIPYGDTGNRSFMDMMLIFVCSILLIPFPMMKERFGNNFGINAPSWSLFWEYIANAFYALLLWKLSRRALTVLTCCAGIALILVGFNCEITPGVLPKNLMGGWGGDTFWTGFARVSYSFLAGILVYRFKWIISSKLGFFGLSALLMATFLLPVFQNDWNVILELIIILFFFPMLVAMGAGAVVSESTKKVCVFSGNISYPLYMTHYFAIWIFGNYFNDHKATGFSLVALIGGCVIVMIGLAYLIMTYIDVPIRNYLTEKRKLRMSQKQ